MHRTINSFVFIALAGGLFAGNSHAHGYTSPEQAVNTYIKAVTTGSGEHIEMAFTPEAMIQYYNQNGEFKQFARDEFAKLVNGGNKWDAKVEITELKVTGKAGNATVEFTWGENNQHGYVDYLNLINNGSSWHITNKVAQYKAR